MTRRPAVFAAAAWLWLSAAHGAESLGYTWPDGRLHVNTGDLTMTQPTPGDWQSAFDRAAARWTESTLVTVTTGDLVLAADCRRSGPNSAFFADTFCGESWGATTLATARTYYVPDGPTDGEATHTDLVFNASIDWVIRDGPVFGHEVDFLRVAVHELGHSIGLDHTPDSSAIMYFLSGRTTTPQTDDVFGVNRFYGGETDQIVAFADRNGNGRAELGVVLYEADGGYVLHVRDGGTGEALGSLGLGPLPLVSLAVSPDVTGDGREELVALTRKRDGAYKLRVFDLAARTRIAERRLSAKVRWVDVITLPGGGTVDMVPLGLAADGRVQAPRFDVATAVKTGGVRFGVARDVVELAVVPDASGDLIPDLAALVVNDRGAAVARVRSGADGSPLANLGFGRAYRPLGLAVSADADGNGFPELIQLGQADAGDVRVVRRDLGPGAQTVKTSFGPANRPLGVLALADLNGDGRSDYGVVLEKDDADPRLRLLDGRSGAPFRTFSFTGIGDGRESLAVVGGDGAGPVDVVVLGNADGAFRVQLRDGRSGAVVATNAYP